MHRSWGQPSLIAALALAWTACSTIPPQTYPPHRDLRLRVEYRFNDPEQIWIQVPATGRDLRVFSLLTDPTVAEERYDGTGRWLRRPAATRQLWITAHLRDFGRGGSGATGYRTAAALFPGAHRIHPLAP